jgi:VWFA-related protein
MFLAMVATAAAVAAAPQPPSNDKKDVPKVPGYEHVEVRLAQIDVVVRDRAGRIVSGLGRPDFTVIEDGVPLEVVAVDEWGAEPPPPDTKEAHNPSSAADQAATPAEAPAAAPAVEQDKRSFVIVFDALGDTTALRMSQAKRAALQFVKSHMTARDTGAVYQLDLSLRPLSGITSDRGELEHAIERVAWMPASSMEDQIDESILGDATAAGKDYLKGRLENSSLTAGQQMEWQREHIYQSLTDLASIFQGMPGRRVLVLASPGFPMTTAADQRLQTGGFTLKFRDLIRSLATYGVTVYTLDIGSDNTTGDAGQAIDWRVAVSKLGLEPGILSDLGLDRSLGSGSASSRRQFLGVLAGETGGRMLTATDLNRDFDAIQEESTHFYRIACRVPVTGDVNRYRRTVVEVGRPGAKVTARRGRYSDIVPFDRSPSTGTVMAAVDSLDRYKPLSARGLAIALPTADSKKVPVAVVIEALGPVGIGKDTQGESLIELDFHLVARAAGEVVARYDRTSTVKIKPVGVDFVRRAFRVEGRLDLVPGIYEFQGTVRLADPPQLASWSAQVAVQPPPKGNVPAFVGVTLSSESETDAPVLSRPTFAAGADAFLVKPDLPFRPAAGPEFETGAPLFVLFWLKGLPAEPGEVPKFDLGVHVEDGEGKSVETPSQLLFFGPEPTGGYRGLLGLDLSHLAVGAYALRLSATPKDASVPAARTSMPLIVAPPSTRPPAPQEPAPRAITSSASP